MAKRWMKAVLAWLADHAFRTWRIRLATVLALAGWIAVAPASALAQDDHSIWGIAAGPVLAFGTNGSTLGWELSGTASTPLLHFALGGDYGRGVANDEAAHYLAWEPGFVLGASLGVAVQVERPSPYLGAWGGLALPVGPDREPVGDTDYSRLNGLLLSLAIGVRWGGSEIQFYVAPKAGYYEFPNPNS
jgi:hypothetical protein